MSGSLISCISNSVHRFQVLVCRVLPQFYPWLRQTKSSVSMYDVVCKSLRDVISSNELSILWVMKSRNYKDMKKTHYEKSKEIIDSLTKYRTKVPSMSTRTSILNYMYIVVCYFVVVELTN